MSNTLGKNLQVTIFGESHGPYIGCVIDGLPAGIPFNEDFIDDLLAKRRPSFIGETHRIENDHYQIISGVFNHFTSGTPLTVLIENTNQKSNDYLENKLLARPSHADYAAHIKYKGFEDYRGGGHFSGRITAAIVFAGGMVLKALENKGIKIGSHLLSLGTIQDVKFSDFDHEIDEVNHKAFPVIDKVEEKMKTEMEKAAGAGDSIGGIIETAIIGLPAGIGEPMFDSLEGNLAKAMFAIGAVKGIEFGRGFAFASSRGSEVNDVLLNDNGVIKTKTNHNGGINGGISNGMPVTFNVVIKPTPSIYKEQNTINLKTKENTTLLIKGRHDPAIVRRANVVIRSMSALVVADLLMEKYGKDYLA